jgi:hypothetical protein
MGADKTTSSWGTCSGSVGPSTRDCTSFADNDCNGTPDNQETAYCQCPATKTQSCLPPSMCTAGSQTCTASSDKSTTGRGWHRCKPAIKDASTEPVGRMGRSGFRDMSLVRAPTPRDVSRAMDAISTMEPAGQRVPPIASTVMGPTTVPGSDAGSIPSRGQRSRSATRPNRTAITTRYAIRRPAPVFRHLFVPSSLPTGPSMSVSSRSRVGSSCPPAGRRATRRAGCARRGRGSRPDRRARCPRRDRRGCARRSPWPAG